MKKYQNFLQDSRMIKDQGLMRHEDIRNQIKILPELEDLIPPLQKEEYAQLEVNIQREGCREALLVWEVPEDSASVQQGEYILIDGHNRFRICTKHGLDFRINLSTFVSFTEVKEYMIDNQLGRRNLSPEQISYLRGKKYNTQKLEKGKYARENHKGQFDPYGSEEEITGEPVGKSDTNTTITHKGQFDPYEIGGTTAEQLAAQFNVSPKTIKRDADFAAGIDSMTSELRKDVLGGRVKMRKSAIIALARGDLPAPTLMPPKSEPNRENDAKRAQLIKEISELAGKLRAGNRSVSKLCDKIMQATERLKEMES